MSLLAILVIISLSAARVTNLIVKDDIFEFFRRNLFLLSPPPHGTWANFHRTKDIDGSMTPAIKDIFGRKYKFDTMSYRKEGFFGSLFSCVNCLGVWISALFVASYFINNDFIYIHLVFAVSMIVSLLSNHYDRDHDDY